MPQRESRKRRQARLANKREPEAVRDERPAARAIWSGSLSFGLVTVPIELYSARRGSAVSLRMLSPDGVPLARQYVCPEEDRPLESDEIVRGYEVAPDEFVVVSDEELEALAPRRTRDIELVRFVERDALDPAYFERAYFLLPAGEQSKAYRLLAELMQASGRAAIAHFVMRDKAYAVAILAEGGVLRAETLRFADELRDARDLGLPKPAAADPARRKKLEKAIEAKARAEVDEDELRDEASERLLALARRKLQRGEDVVELPAEAPDGDESGGEVVDLLALLKQRLREPGRASGRKRARRRAN